MRVRVEAEAKRLYAEDRALLVEAGERWPIWDAADPALRETYRQQAAYLIQVPEGAWRRATRH